MWTNDRHAHPDKPGKYLVVTENWSVMVLDYNAKHEMWNVSDNYTDSRIDVAYWTELPELPKRYVEDFDFADDAKLVYKAIGKEQGDDTSSAAVV